MKAPFKQVTPSLKTTINFNMLHNHGPEKPEYFSGKWPRNISGEMQLLVGYRGFREPKHTHYIPQYGYKGRGKIYNLVII